MSETYEKILSNIESASKDYTPLDEPTNYEKNRLRVMRKHKAALANYFDEGRTTLDKTFFDEWGDKTDEYRDLVNKLYLSGIPASSISKKYEGNVAYSPKITKHGPYDTDDPMSPMMWTDESGERWVDPSNVSGTFDNPNLTESYYEKGIPYIESLIGPLGSILEKGSPSNRIRSNLKDLVRYEDYVPKSKDDQAFDHMQKLSR